MEYPPTINVFGCLVNKFSTKEMEKIKTYPLSEHDHHFMEIVWPSSLRTIHLRTNMARGCMALTHSAASWGTWRVVSIGSKAERQVKRYSFRMWVEMEWKWKGNEWSGSTCPIFLRSALDHMWKGCARGRTERIDTPVPGKIASPSVLLYSSSMATISDTACWTNDMNI